MYKIETMVLRSLLSSLMIWRSAKFSGSAHTIKVLDPSTHYKQLMIYKLSTDLSIKKDSSSKQSGLDKYKEDLIKSLNFQSPEDALPFYKLPIKTLVHISKTTKDDEAKNFCKNRLYYISSLIKVPPQVLSERLAKRSFIYSLSFDWIAKSLKELLDMGVSGDRILRDLWVLKYHHKTIHERLKNVRNRGVDNLYPWMVRCSEEILTRSIIISQETKNILGENKSTLIYLANRLNTSTEAVEEMCSKMPALRTIRVTKVKNFLDFLIKEGFNVEDIAVKPRILSASQKTVEKRLEKLRELGLNDVNLNVLCRSRKGFKRFCESIESSTNESDKTTDPVKL